MMMYTAVRILGNNDDDVHSCEDIGEIMMMMYIAVRILGNNDDDVHSSEDIGK